MKMTLTIGYVLLTMLIGAAGAKLIPSRSAKALFISIAATPNDALSRAGDVVGRIRGHVDKVPRVCLCSAVKNCGVVNDKRDDTKNALVIHLGS